MDALHDIDDEILKSPWGKLGRGATFGVVSGAGKLILNVLNTTTVTNHETLLSAVLKREPGKGLLTISNHTSMFDDPGLVSSMVPWAYFWTDGITHNGMRYAMCAADVCFRNAFLRQFFLTGKTLPVKRGEGVDQPVLNVTAGLLARGGWVHVFPEGRINVDGTLGPCKWGVGKLVCDARVRCGEDPLVLPFYHSGMGRVLPLQAKVPSVGHSVEVLVGEPMDLSSLTCNCGKAGMDQQQVWKDITTAMFAALQQLEKGAPPNPDQSLAWAEILKEREKVKLAKLKAQGAEGGGGGGGAGVQPLVLPSPTAEAAAAEAAAAAVKGAFNWM
ncbi:MAG: hypothetical protein WDW38_001563 [Sanguina aurantia]